MTTTAIKRRKSKARRTKIRGQKLIDTPLPEGLPEDPDDIVDEIQGYMDVLLGRLDPPINKGIHTLQEVATAYYARAMELTVLILAAERDGAVFKGSGHYRVRTGELRAFTELAKRAADLGSRRLTAEQLRAEQRLDSAAADVVGD